MAKDSSFDVVSKADLNEVKIALDQAEREIVQRYDFKGAKVEMDLDVTENRISILADDDFRLKNVIDVLQSKLVKRAVSLKFLDYGKVEPASGGTVRQHIKVKQGINKEVSKKIIDSIKGLKLKVQPSIQEDQIRVSGKEKDDLQKVIAHLKEQDFGIALQFTNYR